MTKASDENKYILFLMKENCLSMDERFRINRFTSNLKNDKNDIFLTENTYYFTLDEFNNLLLRQDGKSYGYAEQERYMLLQLFLQEHRIYTNSKINRTIEKAMEILSGYCNESIVNKSIDLYYKNVEEPYMENIQFSTRFYNTKPKPTPYQQFFMLHYVLLYSGVPQTEVETFRLCNQIIKGEISDAVLNIRYNEEPETKEEPKEQENNTQCEATYALFQNILKLLYIYNPKVTKPFNITINSKIGKHKIKHIMSNLIISRRYDLNNNKEQYYLKQNGKEITNIKDYVDIMTSIMNNEAMIEST